MAVSEGLAIDLSICLGIPDHRVDNIGCDLWPSQVGIWTALFMDLTSNSCLSRHPRLPEPDACKTQDTWNWLNLYHTTRPRIKHPPGLFLSIISDRSLAESFVEKIRTILESLRILRNLVAQEVYMMEDGAKVLKWYYGHRRWMLCWVKGQTGMAYIRVGGLWRFDNIWSGQAFAFWCSD